MSGPTKGGNYIIQSSMGHPISMEECLDRYSHLPETQKNLRQLLTVHDYMDLSLGRRHSIEGAVMPSDSKEPNPPNEVSGLLRIARSMIGEHVQPIADLNPCGEINLYDLLYNDLSRLDPIGVSRVSRVLTIGNGLEQTEAECQAAIGADDICGLPENSPIHDMSSPNPNHHKFENAGVAQSAEQDFRKVEAVGSTPISSSMKLNKEQVDALKSIVHRRLQLEDLRKAVDDAEKALNTAKRAQAEAQRTYDITFKRVERQAKEAEGLLYDAEALLRKLIVEDVLVKGAPEPTPESEKPVEVVEEHDELGRAE